MKTINRERSSTIRSVVSHSGDCLYQRPHQNLPFNRRRNLVHQLEEEEEEREGEGEGEGSFPHSSS